MQGMRPTRVAGLVLIVVAVVAVGLGIFALTSNGSPEAQGRPPATTTSAPPTTTTQRTTSKAPTTTRSTTTQPPTTTTPTTTIAPPPNPTQTLQSSVPVIVLNNSMIPKLATNAANEFRHAGFDVTSVGNLAENPSGSNDLATTTVFFGPQAGEQQIAEAMGSEWQMQVQPRTATYAFEPTGVLVIVTDDFKGGAG